MGLTKEEYEEYVNLIEAHHGVDIAELQSYSEALEDKYNRPIDQLISDYVIANPT